MNSIIAAAPASTLPTLLQQVSILARRQSALYQQFAQALTQITRFVWANQDATPQQVFDAFRALGYRGGDLFVNAAAAQVMLTLVAHPELIPAVYAALGAAAPASLVPDGYSYAIAADGSVAVTAPTPTPAP